MLQTPFGHFSYSVYSFICIETINSQVPSACVDNSTSIARLNGTFSKLEFTKQRLKTHSYESVRADSRDATLTMHLKRDYSFKSGRSPLQVSKQQMQKAATDV